MLNMGARKLEEKRSSSLGNNSVQDDRRRLIGDTPPGTYRVDDDYPEQDFFLRFRDPSIEGRYVAFAYPAQPLLVAVICLVCGLTCFMTVMMNFQLAVFSATLSDWISKDDASWQQPGTEKPRLVFVVNGVCLWCLSFIGFILHFSAKHIRKKLREQDIEEEAYAAESMFFRLILFSERPRVVELYAFIVSVFWYLEYPLTTRDRMFQWCNINISVLRVTEEDGSCPDFFEGYNVNAFAVQLILPFRFVLFSWWYVVYIIVYFAVIMLEGDSIVPSDGIFVSWCFLMCGLFLLFEYNSRRRFHTVEKLRKMNEEILSGKKAVHTLLYSLLPASVIRRVIDGKTICDQQTGTVLFSDVVGFTKWCSTRTAAEVVEMLNMMYSKFDHHARKNALEKVKTIGDAYWTVCGLPEGISFHATRTVRFAFAALRAMGEMRLFGYADLKIRIGIHTGEVCGGLAGTQAATYDIFGATNEIAEHAEQKAPNCGHMIAITATTFKHIQEELKGDALSVIAVEELVSHQDDDLRVFAVRLVVGSRFLDGKFSEAGITSSISRNQRSGSSSHLVIDEEVDNCWEPTAVSSDETQNLVDTSDLYMVHSYSGNASVASVHELSERFFDGDEEILNKLLQTPPPGRLHVWEEEEHDDPSFAEKTGTELLSHDIDPPRLHGKDDDDDGEQGMNPFNRDLPTVQQRSVQPNDTSAESDAASTYSGHVTAVNEETTAAAEVQKKKTRAQIKEEMSKRKMKFFLTFADDTLEKEYIADYCRNLTPENSRNVFILLTAVLLVNLIVLVSPASDRQPDHSYALYCITVAISVSGVLLSRIAHPHVLMTLYYATFIFHLAFAIEMTEPNMLTVDIMYLGITYANLILAFGTNGISYLTVALISLICIPIPHFIAQALIAKIYVHNTLSPITILAVWLIAGRKWEEGARSRFIDKKMQKIAMLENKKQHESVSKLLCRIVPPFVVPVLSTWVVSGKPSDRCIAVTYEMAGVLFLRSPSFAAEAGSLAPDEIMRSIQKLGTGVDSLLKRRYPLVTKMKVVGDVFMFGSGLQVLFPDAPNSGNTKDTTLGLNFSSREHGEIGDTVVEEATEVGDPEGTDDPTRDDEHVDNDQHSLISNSNHLAQLCHLALSLQTSLPALITQYNVSAGLNCGPVGGGVVGTDKLVFDIFGDTVNTASRVMSTSGLGVWCSDNMRHRLTEDAESAFSFAEEAHHEMKGKGLCRVTRLENIYE